MSKQYSALRERMETRTLDNGLRICYLPKEGFSKTFAILAANFGSVDASFTFEGTALRYARGRGALSRAQDV